MPAILGPVKKLDEPDGALGGLALRLGGGGAVYGGGGGAFLLIAVPSVLQATIHNSIPSIYFSIWRKLRRGRKFMIAFEISEQALLS